MSSIEKSERAYADELWDQLAFSDSTTIIIPPANVEGVELPLQPMTDFSRLPDTDDFIDRFGEMPHAVLNLGQGALLALVNDVTRNNPIHGAMQRVVALSLHGKRELPRSEVPLHGLALGRGWISGEAAERSEGGGWENPATLFAVRTNWRVRGNLLDTSARVAIQSVIAAPQPSEPAPLYLPSDWKL